MSWEPGIVVFCCNVSPCAGKFQPADGSFPFPQRVKIVRVSGAGLVSENMIMSALRSGADGILVVGGAAGDCQSAGEQEGNRRRFVLLGNLLEFIGIESGRVHIAWEPVLEGEQVRVLVQDLVEKVKELGPARRLVKQIEPMQAVE